MTKVIDYFKELYDCKKELIAALESLGKIQNAIGQIDYKLPYINKLKKEIEEMEVDLKEEQSLS